MIRMAAMYTLFAGLGLLACTDKPSPEPSVAASLASTAPASTPQTAAPPVDRWQRAAAAEPDPVAKVLYRRGMDLVVQGRLVEAQPLFEQIRREHPRSRFAVRLTAAGGHTGGPIAILASLASMLAVAAQQ